MPKPNQHDHETTRGASSKFWKRCFQLALIMFLPTCFVAWICFFRDVPLEISKETTYITEPLTADGKRVDYFRALELETYPPTMKTDDNGYRLIIRTLGPPSGTHPELVPQLYEKLGLDPNVPPTIKYEDPYDFLENYIGTRSTKEDEGTTETLDDINLAPTPAEEYTGEDDADKLIAKTGRPWTLESMPMMADWLKQNEPALDVIAEAVRKPTYCHPLTRKNEQESLFALLLPDIQQTRSYARGLSTRANYRIGTGDIDGAIDDIITCKTFGRHVGKQNCLVSALVGIAIEGIANAINIAGSLDHQPAEAQLQRLVKKLEKLPPRGNLDDSMRWERYAVLDAIQHLTDEKLDNRELFAYVSGSHQPIDKLINILGIDWNTVMSRVNMYFDDPSKVEVFMRRYRSSKIPPFLTPAILLPTSRSEILADIIASRFIPVTDAAQEAFRRTECVDRVQRITLAMLIYEKQHGLLPPAHTVDKNGKPLHSWRVLLLPYLGEEAKKLHAQIKLDEPWDSKHNRKFHTAAIEFYQCPSAKLTPGETTYSVVVGKKTAFQAGEGKKLEEFGPKSARMILVLESDTPGCWMNPTSDLTESNAEDALRSNVHPGIIVTGLRGGGVSSVSSGIDLENFRKGLEGTASEWNE